MTDTNPYQSPATEAEPQKSAAHKHQRLRGLAAVWIFLFWVIVSFEAFLGLVLNYAGNSTQYWPGFVCGGLGLAIGFVATYAMFKLRLFHTVGAASLLAVLATSLCLWCLLTDAPRTIRAMNLQIQWMHLSLSTTPRYWICVGSSAIGGLAGIADVVHGIRTKNLVPILFAGVFGLVCSYPALVVLLNTVFK
jgi:hypothetical protein